MESNPFQTKLDITWVIQIKLWLEDLESGKKTPDDIRRELVDLTDDH